MSSIQPITMNMDISLRVCEGKYDNFFLRTAQKIAIYSVIPFLMIVTFEAIVKNLILINLTNLGIKILNTFRFTWKTGLPHDRLRD